MQLGSDISKCPNHLLHCPQPMYISCQFIIAAHLFFIFSSVLLSLKHILSNIRYVFFFSSHHYNGKFSVFNLMITLNHCTPQEFAILILSNSLQDLLISLDHTLSNTPNGIHIIMLPFIFMLYQFQSFTNNASHCFTPDTTHSAFVTHSCFINSALHVVCFQHLFFSCAYKCFRFYLQVTPLHL